MRSERKAKDLSCGAIKSMTISVSEKVRIKTEAFTCHKEGCFILVKMHYINGMS